MITHQQGLSHAESVTCPLCASVPIVGATYAVADVYVLLTCTCPAKTPLLVSVVRGDIGTCSDCGRRLRPRTVAVDREKRTLSADVDLVVAPQVES